MLTNQACTAQTLAFVLYVVAGIGATLHIVTVEVSDCSQLMLQREYMPVDYYSVSRVSTLPNVKYGGQMVLWMLLNHAYCQGED